VSHPVRIVGAGSPALVDLVTAARLSTLEEILRWGAHVHAVIVQDEYTHDVVTTPPRADGFLVFDTT
jgi:hypothetical protein